MIRKEININKTKYLTKAQEKINDLATEERREMEGTDKFKYLGLIISKSELRKKKLGAEWDKP